MTAGLLLRPVERDDLTALAALEAACFPDPWTETGLGLLLSRPYGGLCAVQAGAVVGYVGWMYLPAGDGIGAEAEIARIAVAPAVRRCGIGRALLDAMLAAITPNSPSLSVYLDVRESNRGAQALYEAFGFVRNGRRPRFYGDEDAREYILTIPKG